MMAALRLMLSSALWLALAACTPSHTVATGEAVAGKLHLQDGVEVERSNQRLLSRHAQVCLTADQRTESRSVLDAMQRGFSGYFVAVGIDNAPRGYGEVAQNPPCPGAQYVFYLDIAELQCRGERAPDGQCLQPLLPKELIVTVLNRDDRTLADRIRLTFTRGLWSPGDQQQRLQGVFDRLAAMLTGAAGGGA